MPSSEALQNARSEIEMTVRDLFRKRIILSERAAICLEQLYYDKRPYSWQLRLLRAIMETTPAIYNSLTEIHDLFHGFDYDKLRPAIVGAKIRSERQMPQDFRSAINGLISEPDTGGVHVIYTLKEYVPKREILGHTLTVDDLVELLFWNLHSGKYISDIALAMLHLTRRQLDLRKTNRWWLERFEGIATETDRIDPCYSSQQWILYSDGRKYRIRPFGAWCVNQFGESPLKDGSLWVARGNVIQPPSRFSEEAITELEELINRHAAEKDFQKFFERHPEFLLALGDYKAIHPHLVLHEDTGEGLVPDFFLEKITGDYCDILDLKRADAALFRRQKHRQRFLDTVNEGISQLEEYRNWFEDRANRHKFYDRYGLRVYRPRVTLIIGRDKGIWQEAGDLRTKGLVPQHTEIKTYSEVVEAAKQYKKLFTI